MKAIFFANTDWYLYNFRLAYAKFLRKQGWEVVFLSPNGDHADRLIREGFRHIALDLSRNGIDPFAELHTIRRIHEVYLHEKPDLVHQFTIKCVIYGSLAAKSLRIPTVNAITGLGYVFLSDTLKARIIRALVKTLYKTTLHGSQVVFENPDDAELFTRIGLIREEQKNIILGTGIDPEKFAPAAEAEGIPLTILPARMLWDKGVGEFVEAARLIQLNGISARFALVGNIDEGNPSSISESQIHEWKNSVEWWGWQENMAAILKQAHIVCLPSYREGLPRVLIEANACGKPIVTTDVPGCREAVRDGINGLLVPVKNAEALAEALTTLITDPARRSSMGIQSREMAIHCFSDDIVNHQTYSVYQKVL